MNKPVRNLIKVARRVCSLQMLSADKERALIFAWQPHGNRRARDRMIKAFAPLAASLAKPFKRGSGEADLNFVQHDLPRYLSSIWN
jgi:RNA polymerase sigma-32 factor